ncbi:MAG TPA: VOC family protein [Gemmatales bacterium]|nr:VOC family protein [Gemmatales bacterium]
MRWRAPGFVICLALFSLTSISVEALPQHYQPLVQAVESIGMTVSDLDRSVEFYTKVLDFEKLGEEERFGDAYERSVGLFAVRSRTAKLKLGDEVIELTEFLTPRGRAIPADSASNDHWFQHMAIIVNDIDTAYQKLTKHKIRHLSPSPQRLPDWNKNAGGIEAFYFADPDGHPLEILHFPPDKGDAKWHKTTNKLFLLGCAWLVPVKTMGQSRND